MYNFTKKLVIYIAINTYKLQITKPINIVYSTNNIKTFWTEVDSK